MIRNLFAAMTSIFLMSSALAATHDEVEDWLSRNWYATEVIVFQRVSVMEENSAEKLVLLADRHFPFNLRTFEQTPQAVGSSYRLDPSTLATLDFPIFDINIENFRLLVPALISQDDEYVGASEDSLEPTITQGESRPPPVINPVLEPNPLLDFLAELGRFEKSLDEQSYRWLPIDELLMSRDARRIGARDEFTILIHGRWIQPVPPRNQPEPLLIQSGAHVDNTRQLEGTLAVTLGRYLHFQATLWYKEPALGQMPLDIALGDTYLAGYSPNIPIDHAARLSEPDKSYMLLSQSRRLRSDEIHYLDHPKIGIVVRIDRVAIPDELALRFDALKEVDEQSLDALNP